LRDAGDVDGGVVGTIARAPPGPPPMTHRPYARAWGWAAGSERRERSLLSSASPSARTRRRGASPLSLRTTNALHASSIVWYADDDEEDEEDEEEEVVAAESEAEEVNGGDGEGEEADVVEVADFAESIRGTLARTLYERIILPLPGQSLPTDTTRQPAPPSVDGWRSLRRDDIRASPPTPDGGGDDARPL
jgi:hypothetical protein